jgi:8-oxo-dGTP pyrophosphatase MutT (NUDIX family)
MQRKLMCDVSEFLSYLSQPGSGVSIKHVIENLKDLLAIRPILRIHDSKMKVSAVLVPVFVKNGQYHLLFIQRTERVKEHKGQISFPGGSYEKADGSLLNTALREAQEEIGLAPDDVKILGELDDTATATSNYIISPFIGLIPYPYSFKPDKWETEELIEIPIIALLDKNCFREGITVQNGQEIDTYFYQYGDRSVWGATAKILWQFLEIFRPIGIS